MAGETWLEALLHPPVPAVHEDARAFWAAHRPRAAGLRTVDEALVGGLHADRLAWAFLAGYRGALRALDPALPEDALAALCATEAGGVHPRDIRTTARREGGEVVVDGEKVFATMADQADVLLVVASEGQDAQGRNRLVVVRVAANAPGVTRAPSPLEVPFAPEISHQVVRFQGARAKAEAVLPGDGYEDALKPFRSVEDAHVFAAGMAYLCGVAGRSGWPAAFRERALCAVLALRELAMESRLRSAESHLALGGALALGREVVDASEAHWDGTAGPERDRWRRDRALFDVAGRVRAARLEAARRRLVTPP
ncbi:MAG TPA: acyl-CoA dehydrogenase family protein [Myxococcales bacterium]|nr:acyl-CoA dehydrogenase family protein [Myxococcales bacterium]